VPATDVARPPEIAGPIERHCNAPNGRDAVGFGCVVVFVLGDGAGDGADGAAVPTALGDVAGAGVAGSRAAPAETHNKTASADAAVDRMKRIMRPRFDAL